MKKIFPLFLLLLITSLITSAQSQVSKNNPVGKWKFEAPYAPEGYNTGTIEFSLNDDKYSTSITFTGSSYKIPGEKTTVEKDTVRFTVYVEGTEVAINLLAESNTKMTGKAVTYEGEIPLTLTKEPPVK